jgi:endonuclease/exonuclease/phosphatase family metal-dependent hydrolase
MGSGNASVLAGYEMSLYSRISHHNAFLYLSIFLILLIGYLSSREQSLPVTVGFQLNTPDEPLDAQLSNQNSFRIGTYNIHGGKDVDGNDNFVQIIDILLESQLDVIALNEVRDGIFPGSNISYEIANHLNMGWLFAPTREKDFQSNYGNAFLSKLPVIDYKIQPLIYRMANESSVVENDTHRNMIISTLLVNNIEITIIVTHLDRGPLKERQLEEVLEIFRMHSPAILIGDLNVTPSNSVLRSGMLANEYDNALSDITTQAQNTIDWILVRGLTVLDYGTTPAGPSDHPHYWAELSLTNQLSLQNNSD